MINYKCDCGKTFIIQIYRDIKELEKEYDIKENKFPLWKLKMKPTLKTRLITLAEKNNIESVGEFLAKFYNCCQLLKQKDIGRNTYRNLIEALDKAAIKHPYR